jgi:hypothetical protein
VIIADMIEPFGGQTLFNSDACFGTSQHPAA